MSRRAAYTSPLLVGGGGMEGEEGGIEGGEGGIEEAGAEGRAEGRGRSGRREGRRGRREGGRERQGIIIPSRSRSTKTRIHDPQQTYVRTYHFLEYSVVPRRK